MNDLKRPLIAVHVGVGGSVGPIDRKQTFQDCLSLFRVKLVVLTARFRSIPESRQFQSRSALRICAGINQPVGVCSEMTFVPNDTEQIRPRRAARSDRTTPISNVPLPRPLQPTPQR